MKWMVLKVTHLYIPLRAMMSNTGGGATGAGRRQSRIQTDHPVHPEQPRNVRGIAAGVASGESKTGTAASTTDD